MDQPTPVLSAQGLSKAYGGIRALQGAGLVIARPGVVHGLLGQNGSGKSTLLGVLSGQLRPDAGEVRLSGERVALGSTAAALGHGIAMVSQENATAPQLTIAENILMGRRLGGRSWRISWRETMRRAGKALAALELDYDPRWLVGDLRPDQRQMVEIARAMSLDARVLILDEPTSSLSDYEVERLFSAVRRLSGSGVSTIFVSHRLTEFFALVDEVSVLRDGRTVATGQIDDFTPARLVRAMVGDVVEPVRRATPPGALPPPAARMAVRGLRAAPLLQEVDLEVRAGEIVGIAGLSGCGRTELLQCLFGARRSDGGDVTLDGVPVRLRTPTAAIRAGLGYLPPDRKTEGVVLDMSVEANLRMTRTATRPRWARPGTGVTEIGPLVDRMGVRAASPTAPVSSLSGGNQQKVALGKWLLGSARFLLLDEPTRGVDAAAKADIHGLLRDLAAAGRGLLVSSSENDELLELCDRVVVMFRGRVTAVLEAGGATEAQIAHHSGGFE